MTLDNKKFCKKYLKDLVHHQADFQKLNEDMSSLEKVFKYIHNLNGVALTYGFEHIAFVAASAHELIFHFFDQKRLFNEEIKDLFISYYEMLHIVLQDEEENHLNTKEALHLLDGFKFHLEHLEKKSA